MRSLSWQNHIIRKCSALNRLFVYLLQFILTLTIPAILVLFAARSVMSETWLNYEYERDDFPSDLFGWEDGVRLEYGPYGIRYILSNEDISLLSDLIIDGEPAFTESELAHMQDVQIVAQTAFRVLYGLLLFMLAAAVILFAQPETYPLFWRAIWHGGILTIALAALLLTIAAISWDFFFDTFHALFFAEGSWQFYTSDTLIRLYPQQFWFDSAMLAGAITIGGAPFAMLLARILGRRGKIPGRST